MPVRIDPTDPAVLGLTAPHLCAAWISGGQYKLWPHVCHIGRAIERCVADPRGGRLLINLGPGWGKSELISVATPTWYIARFKRRVILASAANPLATQWSGRVRDNFKNHPELGVTTRDDTDKKADWVTTTGGGMKAVGVGTSTLGFRCGLFVFDDPYGTWKEAMSTAYRRDVVDFYQATVETRLEPGGAVIVLHHRMHPRDLSNFILSQPDASRWVHINLPSLAGENDPLGRKPGESLCEQRFSAEELRAKRLAMGEKWGPMHQQETTEMSKGAAYSHFGQYNLDPSLAFRPDLPLHVSVDFNISPGMHVMLGWHDPKTDLAACFDEIHGPRMNIEAACVEFRRRVTAFPNKPREIIVYGDATGKPKNQIATGQSHYDALFRGMAPLNIPIRDRVADSNPAVIDRVNTLNYAMRDLDGQVFYKVHPRCERLIADFNQVLLDEKEGLDKSNHELTHASDAEGYRIHTIRGFRPAIKQPKGRAYY